MPQDEGAIQVDPALDPRMIDPHNGFGELSDLHLHS